MSHLLTACTDTVLREKLMMKNLKLLFKFLSHSTTSFNFNKVGNDLRGDSFETIILYIFNQIRKKH
jgi:hypothetical protein